MGKEAIAEVRKRSWATRRAKYGQRGHSGPYSAQRPIYTASWNARLRIMEDALIRLHRKGVLSEGQACKMTGMDRISVREAVIAQEKKDKTAPAAAKELEDEANAQTRA